jgi:two-component system response regulator PhoP
MTVRSEIRIAILEDNPDLREELIFFLEAKGYKVWGERSAEVFWKRLHANPVDIVLLDIGLPGEDGFSVLEYLRGLSQYGLIVISARGNLQDRLRGMELGADAYLVKPVNFADLVLTVDQLWQRLRLQASDSELSVPAATARWTLRDKCLSGPDGQNILLTSQEARLISFLMRYPSEVCNKELIHEHLFGHHDECDTHRVDVVLSRLRNKAQRQGISLPIRVVFGKGVVFLADGP